MGPGAGVPALHGGPSIDRFAATCVCKSPTIDCTTLCMVRVSKFIARPESSHCAWNNMEFLPPLLSRPVPSLKKGEGGREQDDF